jgi:hypothetical protein
MAAGAEKFCPMYFSLFSCDGCWGTEIISGKKLRPGDYRAERNTFLCCGGTIEWNKILFSAADFLSTEKQVSRIRLIDGLIFKSNMDTETE